MPEHIEKFVFSNCKEITTSRLMACLIAIPFLNLLLSFLQQSKVIIYFSYLYSAIFLAFVFILIFNKKKRMAIEYKVLWEACLNTFLTLQFCFLTIGICYQSYEINSTIVDIILVIIVFLIGIVSIVIKKSVVEMKKYKANEHNINVVCCGIIGYCFARILLPKVDYSLTINIGITCGFFASAFSCISAAENGLKLFYLSKYGSGEI